MPSSPALQICDRDAHFLSGTEKCCVSLLHAHCRSFRFRIRPARRGVSRRHNLLCPANDPRLSPWSIRNSQAVPGRCSRVAVDMRSGQLRDWRPESNCPSVQIQLESRWLFPHPSAVGNYGQFSAARVRGRLEGRQHLSECTQKSDECCATAPGFKSVVSELDIFISSAGIALDRMNKLKNNAFVGYTGHFDNAINLVGSEGLEGMKIDDFTRLRRMFLLLRRPRCDRVGLQERCCGAQGRWKNCENAHLSPGPAVVRRSPGRSCAGSASDKKSTLCAYQMAVPGERRTENPR